MRQCLPRHPSSWLTPPRLPLMARRCQTRPGRLGGHGGPSRQSARRAGWKLGSTGPSRLVSLRRNTSAASAEVAATTGRTAWALWSESYRNRPQPGIAQPSFPAKSNNHPHTGITTQTTHKRELPPQTTHNRVRNSYSLQNRVGGKTQLKFGKTQLKFGMSQLKFEMSQLKFDQV